MQERDGKHQSGIQLQDSRESQVREAALRGYDVVVGQAGRYQDEHPTRVAAPPHTGAEGESHSTSRQGDE